MHTSLANYGRSSGLTEKLAEKIKEYDAGLITWEDLITDLKDRLKKALAIEYDAGFEDGVAAATEDDDGTEIIEIELEQEDDEE